MQGGELIVGLAGVTAFVALCLGLAVRKHDDSPDLEQLEQQAREEQKAQVRNYRASHH